MKMRGCILIRQVFMLRRKNTCGQQKSRDSNGLIFKRGIKQNKEDYGGP
jgi:hypothetical protein